MAKLYLSKSKLMGFRQCPKRLYLEVHRSELAEISESMEQVFATGHQVGEIARQQHPGGILIEHDQELAQALRDTKETLAKQPDKPLFEATFQHDGVLIRADLLLPGGNRRGHNLVEVKSSTEVKPHYLADCAIQTWVTEGAGYPLGRVELAHIDTSFVYPGGGDYRGLLHHADITAEVRSLLSQVPEWAEEARRTLAGLEPAIAVGKQCGKPHECPFHSYCAGPQPEYPVSLLPYGSKVVEKLLAEGIRDVRDIPADRLTNPKHVRVWRATVNNRSELDGKAAEALAKYPYSRYYLDFETIQFAVPIWPGTRPYQRLPFQWSCHIERAGGTLMHESFLGGLDGTAPMEALTQKLIETLNRDGAGPIFVYNRGFEAGCISDLAVMYPEYTDSLKPILNSLVDLLPLMRESYYHPAMKGSWSLKAALPTISPELDYANLDHVQDGGMAGIAYMEILDPNTSAERRQELIRGLLEYCKQDTLGLVRVARFLQGKPG